MYVRTADKTSRKQHPSVNIILANISQKFSWMMFTLNFIAAVPVCTFLRPKMNPCLWPFCFVPNSMKGVFKVRQLSSNFHDFPPIYAFYFFSWSKVPSSSHTSRYNS